jgi:DNA mismatch repair ATPase MutS
VDGISLLGCVVSHYVEKPAKALFVLHFTEVLHPEIINEEQRRKIMVLHMDSHRNVDTDEFNDDNAEMRPLYKLRLGVAPSSQGIACARSAGIPEPILQRAIEIKQSLHNGAVLMPTTTTRRLLGSTNEVYLAAIKLLLEKDWSVATSADIIEMTSLLTLI